MSTTIEATFDGSVFRPVSPVDLEPNTTVRLAIEPLPAKVGKPASFLQTARSLNLEGPPDWASNLDKYLYGEEAEGAP
jgi:predicted DNA-binding antitoxin AbrB/MazE fold protein